jgi:hypothetical protein
MVAPRRNGDVGRRIENSSYALPDRTCSIQSMSGDVAPAISGGRVRASAPYARAISAVWSLSVETITASKRPDSRAAAIEYASSGWPASGRTFLPGTRTDPARAGMRATALRPGTGRG